jgi:hypothetical protein
MRFKNFEDGFLFFRNPKASKVRQTPRFDRIVEPGRKKNIAIAGAMPKGFTPSM